MVTEEVKGLKFPLSSVASKDFYRVPAEIFNHRVAMCK